MTATRTPSGPASLSVREGTSSPLKAVILTMFEEPDIVRGIMELGANALIHKSASVEELFAVLRTTALHTEGEHAIVAVPQRALELAEDSLGTRNTARA